jgi:DNA-binding PadR family transcriptional regulator
MNEAFLHRLKILALLNRERSTVEIHRHLLDDAGEDAAAKAAVPSIGVLAYHVRKLAKLGLIEPTREKRVRGAVEHFYRITPAGWRYVRDTKIATDRAWAALHTYDIPGEGAA